VRRSRLVSRRPPFASVDPAIGHTTGTENVSSRTPAHAAVRCRRGPTGTWSPAQLRSICTRCQTASGRSLPFCCLDASVTL
jgi:hypothetical protein